MEDIGVIILNYNSSELTINCVNSIIEHSKSSLKYSIVIVDNNSRNEEFVKLDELKSTGGLSIIRNERNQGFGGGIMTGVEACNSKYYFFLNNDTLLLNDNIKLLFDFMERTPNAGVCAGQMFDPDLKPGINFNYIPDLKLKLLGSGLLRIFSKKKYPKKGARFKDPVEVPVLNGSSLFVRASIFLEVGGFDPEFFLYCEEEDLAIRMKKAGFYSYLVPEAQHIHFQGQSSMSGNKINYPYLKEFYISQHYLYLKHFGKSAAMIWRITQFFRSLRKFYIHSDYIRLAFIILLDPSLKNSLRHQEGREQEIRA